MNPVPASLRKKASEEAYQNAKIIGTLKPLSEEKILKEWTHWKLIDNRFPYDSCFKTHHMLIPKREVAYRWQLEAEESKELDDIIFSYCNSHYDMVFENMTKRRSVLALFHLHAASYFDNRDEFAL